MAALGAKGSDLKTRKRGILRNGNPDGKRRCQKEFACYFARPMPRSIARRKTKKSAAKRVKITGTGKIMRRKPGLRHLASSKSSKRKRKLGKDGQVHETMVARIKECLPFH
ncbi:MAG: 50S ribosomal protein L35 [Chthoniobacteraceae bacterium]